MRNSKILVSYCSHYNDSVLCFINMDRFTSIDLFDIIRCFYNGKIRLITFFVVIGSHAIVTFLWSVVFSYVMILFSLRNYVDLTWVSYSFELTLNWTEWKRFVSLPDLGQWRPFKVTQTNVQFSFGIESNVSNMLAVELICSPTGN